MGTLSRLLFAAHDKKVSQTGEFIVYFVIRIVYGLLQRTYFVPDEHWQGPEIAHLLVFGSGYASWEWWVGLRSYVHPAVLFGGLYRVLDWTGLDNHLTVVYGPRIVQASIAALGDMAFARVVRQIQTSPEMQMSAILLHLVNWFGVFTYSRTIVNSCEVALVLKGVEYYMDRESAVWLAGIAGLAFAIRPTSVLFFLPLCLSLAIERRRELGLIVKCVVVALAIVGLGVVLDMHLYTDWGGIPAWNFVKFNLGLGIAENYGTHPWHFYGSVGLCSYFLTSLPALMSGMRRLPTAVLVGCGLSIGVLSLSGHKELRFVVPVFAVLSTTIAVCSTRITMLLHILLAVFFSRWQGVAPDQVMALIRYEASLLTSVESDFPFAAPVSLHVLFLGCHATPYTTHIHDYVKLVSLEFIECAPTQITGKQLSEQSVFARNPGDWVVANVDRVSNADIVVLTEESNETMTALGKIGFRLHERIWDGFFGESQTSTDWGLLAGESGKYFAIMKKSIS